MYAPGTEPPSVNGGGSCLERYALVNTATFRIDHVRYQLGCGVARLWESLPSPITGRGGAS